MDIDGRVALFSQDRFPSSEGRAERPGTTEAGADAMALGLRPAAVPRRRILVVEPAPEVALLLVRHLKQLASEVCVCRDGPSALAQARRDPADLIVLDAVLPGIGGLDVCRALRESAIYTPALVFSGGASEIDRVMGLELGADDYLTEPSMVELVARAKALLRRAEYLGRPGGGEQARALRIADLVVDLAGRRVERAGGPVKLTEKEFDLLFLFASSPGRVYTRSQLLDLVWGRAQVVNESAVTTHVNRLRSKIEAVPRDPALIVTVWGVGYRLEESPHPARPRPLQARQRTPAQRD